MDWSELEQLVKEVLEAQETLKVADEKLDTLRGMLPDPPQVVTSKEEWNGCKTRRDAALTLIKGQEDVWRRARNETNNREADLLSALPMRDIWFKLNGHAVKRNTYQLDERLEVVPWEEFPIDEEKTGSD